MDYNEKPRWELHKNAACCLEEIFEIAPHKKQLYDHLPPITQTIQVRRKSHIGQYHHHQVALVARIAMTLLHHASLSHIALGRYSAWHPESLQSCSM